MTKIDIILEIEEVRNMSDTTTNPIDILPQDAWNIITKQLDQVELTQFRKTCNNAYMLGEQPMAALLQQLYNRLYAIDKTIPPLFLQEDPLVAFHRACNKVHARQQAEMLYLKAHHHLLGSFDWREEPGSLNALEKNSKILDGINKKIISKKLDIAMRWTGTSLSLDKCHITRIPLILLTEEKYNIFFSKMTDLNCRSNFITELDLTGLASLIVLNCIDNQIAKLNIRDCPNLRFLSCFHNELESLDLEGLKSLECLWCHGNKISFLSVKGASRLEKLQLHDNPIKYLDITDTPAVIQKEFAQQEKELLFAQLSQAATEEQRQKIIDRLGKHYTDVNRALYCLAYAAKWFVHHSVNQLCYMFSSLSPSQQEEAPNNAPKEKLKIKN